MGRENLARAPPPPKRDSKSSEAVPQSADSGAPDWIRSYDGDGRVELLSGMGGWRADERGVRTFYGAENERQGRESWEDIISNVCVPCLTRSRVSIYLKKVKEHRAARFSSPLQARRPRLFPAPASAASQPKRSVKGLCRGAIASSSLVNCCLPRRLQMITRMSSGGLLTGRDVGGNLAAHVQFSLSRGAAGI
jgi:hypothetical protein